jgi:hypothetical protein
MSSDLAGAVAFSGACLAADKPRHERDEGRGAGADVRLSDRASRSALADVVNDKPVTHSVLAMLSPDRKGTAPELAGCSESCAEWATLTKHFTGSMA